jgi:preprotein translocase subunit SecE
MSSLAKPESGSAEVGFWRSLGQLAMYKPAQGRLVRQLTGIALAALLLLIAYETATMSYMVALLGNGHFLLMIVLGLLAVWVAYRLVNYPKFADFLIAVEAEMNKVSWPSQPELVRASIVVMAVIFLMAMVLYGFDVFWTKFLQLIRVRI